MEAAALEEELPQLEVRPLTAKPPKEVLLPPLVGRTCLRPRLPQEDLLLEWALLPTVTVAWLQALWATTCSRWGCNLVCFQACRP